LPNTCSGSLRLKTRTGKMPGRGSADKDPAGHHPSSIFNPRFVCAFRLAFKSRKSMLIIANRVPIPGFPKFFENSLKISSPAPYWMVSESFFPLNPFLKNQCHKFRTGRNGPWRLNGRRSRWPGTASHRPGSCSVIFNDSSDGGEQACAGLDLKK